MKSRRSSSLAWSEVIRGMGLFHRDSIKTGAGAKGVLVFEDRSQVNIGENTLVVVVGKRESQAEKRSQNVISMPTGTIGGKPGPHELLVKTPRGWIRASGTTAFRASLTPTGKMEVVATGEPVRFVTAEGETEIKSEQKLTIPESKEFLEHPISIEGDPAAALAEEQRPPAVADAPPETRVPVHTEEKIVITGLEPVQETSATPPPASVSAPAPAAPTATPMREKPPVPKDVFTITEPKSGVKTTAATTRVRGVLTGRYRVFLNGKPIAAAAGGSFEIDIPLQPGVNPLTFQILGPKPSEIRYQTIEVIRQ